MTPATTGPTLKLTEISGPTRVVGPPGSGKTELLVALTVEWLRAGRDPHRLVVVTRSHSGAREVERRIEARLPAAHLLPLVLTHEGLARIVLLEAGAAGERGRGLDRIGEWMAMREALRLSLPTLVRLRPLAEDPWGVEDALEFCSLVKQSLVGPGLLAERLGRERGILRELPVVAANYEAVLERMGARDTRDLVADALDALGTERELLTDWADVLLVDEAEDLSPAQWYLLRELARRLPPPQRALLAGDSSTSIPAFRGPSSRYFDQVFPAEVGPQEIALPARGPAWVARLTGELGLESQAALPVEHWGPGAPAPEEGGAEARVWLAADETEEAFAIAREIKRAVLAGEVGYHEVAVLVRSAAAQMGPLTSALEAIGVPARVERTRWSSSLAVRVVTLWLRALGSGDDEELLLDLLRSGPCPVPLEQILRLRQAAARRQLPLARMLWQQAEEGAVASDIQNAAAPPTAESDVRRLAVDWRRLGGGIPQGGRAIINAARFQELVGEIELASGLAELAWTDADTASALAQLNLALADATSASQRLGRAELPLWDWLELLRIAIRRSGWDTESAARDGVPEVTLLTIHQAKGRRWRRVFLVGLVEGVMPARGRDLGLLDSDELQRLVEAVPELEDGLGGPGRQLDEERRLLLVAVTRATEQLTCSWSARQGERPVQRSPFIAALIGAGLEELPAPSADLVTPTDCLATMATMARVSDSPPGGGDGWGAAQELARMLDRWDPVLEGAAQTAEPLALSATALREWLACPRLFYYRRLRLGQEEAVPLVLGTAAHRLLQLGFEHQRESAPGGRGFPAAAEEILAREVMPEVRARLLDPLEALYVELWLLRLVDRWETRMLAPGPAAVGRQLASEVSFRTPLGDHQLTGKVDALWRHPGGEVEVVDFKTSTTDLPSSSTLRAQVFGAPGEGPSDWQLPIYQLAARQGAFSQWIEDAQPVWARNWYVGVDPGAKSPLPLERRGFRIGADGQELPRGAALLTDVELDHLAAELERQAAQVADGRFPAQPRHRNGTCLGFGGCPLAFCCEGDGSVGAGIELPPPWS